MKTPVELILYPLDTKKDDDGGLWCRVPSWIVRAYKLKEYGTNMGKIKIIIKKDKRSILEYRGEEECRNEYFMKNWSKKLNREKRKARQEND